MYRYVLYFTFMSYISVAYPNFSVGEEGLTPKERKRGV